MFTELIIHLSNLTCPATPGKHRIVRHRFPEGSRLRQDGVSSVTGSQAEPRGTYSPVPVLPGPPLSSSGGRPSAATLPAGPCLKKSSVVSSSSFLVVWFIILYFLGRFILCFFLCSLSLVRTCQNKVCRQSTNYRYLSSACCASHSSICPVRETSLSNTRFLLSSR